MDCREFLHRYSDYDDSLLPPGEVDRFRAHMAECRSCARYDRVLRKGRMLARQLPRPEPSPDFIPRLQLRLRRGHGRRTGGRSAALATGLAAATVLMVAATTVSFLSAPGDGATAAARAPNAPRFVQVSMATPLPPLEAEARRGWTVREVAPAGRASYSPLETGPPVYRARRPSHRTTDLPRVLD